MTDELRFEKDDAGYLAWRAANPDAYVLNVKAGWAEDAVMHRAQCSNAANMSGTSVTTTYLKIGANSEAEARAKYFAAGGTGARLRYCTGCLKHKSGDRVRELDRDAQGRRHWWVNHKQTHVAELDGGFIWSPKRTSDGKRSQTYENLALVRAGDLVFSYAHGALQAVGTATDAASTQPKPGGFGAAGDAWSDTGWHVPIAWQRFDAPLVPKAHWERIEPLLPRYHSPIIRASQRGAQNCYLAAIAPDLGGLLLALAGASGLPAVALNGDVANDRIADERQAEIEQSAIPETEKAQLIMARRGQGRFRAQLLAQSGKCRVTGVAAPDFLVASHIKPWADCTNEERLDPANGMLLSPHVDRLFDRRWISFADDGTLLVANAAIRELLIAWHVDAETNIGPIPERQRAFLEHHRSRMKS